MKAGGEDRPFNYSWGAYRDMQSNVEDSSIQGIELEAFFAFKWGAIRAKKPIDFGVEDVLIWIEDDFSLYNRIKEALLEDAKTFTDQVGKMIAPEK